MYFIPAWQHCEASEDSVFLHSKLTAVSWQISFGGVTEPQQEAHKPVGTADLSDKPLFSKSSGGFTLASKASFPTFARAKQEVNVDSREKQKPGEGCQFETCFQSTAKAGVVIPCSPLTVSLQ